MRQKKIFQGWNWNQRLRILIFAVEVEGQSGALAANQRP